MALVAAVALCLLAQGCASRAARADRLARDNGYQKLHLPGDGFGHLAWFKPAVGGSVLHVYIEHDGTPWRNPTTPAPDPTPDNPLMLALMSQDPAPALYLGRPCYFGTAPRPPCEPIWWTHRRFSPQVIRSMEAALRQFLMQRPPFDAIHFIGYSGGGVVAALLAARFGQARRLVTIGAPLDLDGWVQLHRYSPLEGSISPLTQPPLPASVQQLHLAGGDDHVVPGRLIEAFVRRQPAATFIEVRGYDHHCCWAGAWRRLLDLPNEGDPEH